MASPPKRVLMTADARGGVWTYALELAGGLRGHGVEVLLAVLGGGVTGRHRAEASQIEDLQLVVHEGKLEWMQDPWSDVEDAGKWLLQLAADFKPDIAHLNGYAHGALPWKIPVVVAGHSCVLSWWQAVRGEAAPLNWRPYQPAVERGLHAADLVVAPSHAMLQALDRHYGPVPCSRVIHNGRNSAEFHAGAKQNIIFSAGRLWDDAKNLSVLAEAAAGIEWPLFAAGQAEHPEGGERVFGSMHTLGNLGPTELKTWYRHAAIYALPALYEPFGYTALEAALSGCALVLSDIESLREIWGDAAVYVNPRDGEAWRGELNSLIQDSPRRSRIADAARVRALQLNPVNMTREYLMAYQRAAIEQARRNQPCGSFSSVIPCGQTGITETLTSSGA